MVSDYSSTLSKLYLFVYKITVTFISYPLQPCYENIPFMMATMPPMAASYNQTIANKDFLSSQSFIAQNELELRQRQEHSEMLTELTRMREQQIRLVEADIKDRMERAVQDLLNQIEKGKTEFDRKVWKR